MLFHIDYRQQIESSRIMTKYLSFEIYAFIDSLKWLLDLIYVSCFAHCKCKRDQVLKFSNMMSVMSQHMHFRKIEMMILAIES